MKFQSHLQYQLNLPNKFFLTARATGAAGLANFRPPSPDELGYAKLISVQEIGGTSCTVLQQGGLKRDPWTLALGKRNLVLSIYCACI